MNLILSWVTVYVNLRFAWMTHGQRIKGTIIEVYIFHDEYRYVVAFDDGKDGVFFDSEILPT